MKDNVHKCTLKNVLFRQICQSIHQYKVYKDTLFTGKYNFFLMHIIYQSVAQLWYNFRLSLMPLTLLTHTHCSLSHLCFFPFLCFSFFSNIFKHTYTYMYLIHTYVSSEREMRHQSNHFVTTDGVCNLEVCAHQSIEQPLKLRTNKKKQLRLKH